MSQLVSPWGTTKADSLARLPAIHKEELTALEQQRTQCMKDGRIKAARMAEQQLQELKLQQEAEQLQALQSLHQQQAEQLEQQLRDDYTSFTDAWDARMAALQERGEEQQQQLLQKHLDETAAASAAPQQLSQRQRPSPELLNLRRIQETLLAQKQFEQALQTKHKADQLESAEQAAYTAQEGTKPTAEGAKLLAKQAKEQDAQAIRLSVAQSEAVKKQQGELQRLMKRYQAARLALQRTQATERLHFELRLRGELGIKRPSSRLVAPDLGTSLADAPLISASCHTTCSSPPPMAGHVANTAASKAGCSPLSSAGSSPRSPNRPRTAAAVYAAGPKPLSAGPMRHKVASGAAGQLRSSNYGSRAESPANKSSAKVVKPATVQKNAKREQAPEAADDNEDSGAAAEEAAGQLSDLAVGGPSLEDADEPSTQHDNGSVEEGGAGQE